MDKQLVVISRKWHEPFIRVDVTEVGIGVTMTLEDFVEAVQVELDNEIPWRKAVELVIAGMKKETSKVM